MFSALDILPILFQTAKPKLCADVRESDRDAQDGDYTLYPDSLGGQSATFYCHDMANNPREFVSLSVPNKGEHPDIGNLNCIGETKSPIPSSSGTSSFTKVRVHMKVGFVGVLGAARSSEATLFD